MPCAIPRGSINSPKRTNLNVKKWKHPYSRLAGGTAMFNVQQWYKKAGSALSYYSKLAVANQYDRYDHHLIGSYRENDEVLLARICMKAGIRLPDVPYRFVNGRQLSMEYRGLHLGDFKFPRRYKKGKKMK